MHYAAPKPSYPEPNKLARVFFPPLLFWDWLKSKARKKFGAKVSRLVLPAQQAKMPPLSPAEIQFALASMGQLVDVTQHTIATYDGAELDTVEIAPKVPVIGKPEYIIHVNGNAALYRSSAKDMLDDALTLSCHVIGFDFRGTGASNGEPKTAQDLVTDVIAQVQRLITSGVDPERITLKGHSLGAGVATLAAKYFHDHGQRVNLFNGRSFASLSKVVPGLLQVAQAARKGRAIDGYSATTSTKLLRWLVRPVIKLALTMVGWEMDVASAYKKLPKTHRAYMVVKSSKADRAVRNGVGDHVFKDDAIITDYASLHRAMRSERRQQKKLLAKKERALPASYHDQDYRRKAMDDINSQRNDLSMRKMAVSEGVNGHLEPFDQLKARGYDSGKNANDYFNLFYHRAMQHHDAAQLDQNAAERASMLRRGAKSSK